LLRIISLISAFRSVPAQEESACSKNTLEIVQSREISTKQQKQQDSWKSPIPGDQHQVAILENTRQEVYFDWVPGMQTTRDQEPIRLAKALDKPVPKTQALTLPQEKLREESGSKSFEIRISSGKFGIDGNPKFAAKDLA